MVVSQPEPRKAKTFLWQELPEKFPQNFRIWRVFINGLAKEEALRQILGYSLGPCVLEERGLGHPGLNFLFPISFGFLREKPSKERLFVYQKPQFSIAEKVLGFPMVGQYVFLKVREKKAWEKFRLFQGGAKKGLGFKKALFLKGEKKRWLWKNTLGRDSGINLCPLKLQICVWGLGLFD